MMSDTQQLLADYRANGSEWAFRELVARYLDLVYSTALRLVDNDAHRAQDVAQAVFVDLARLAAKLSPDTMLGGWLHRHTCFVARTVMRGERRRQAREKLAVEMNALENEPDASLAEIAPILDEAINELGPDDRDAILLRFFERQNLRSVGEALGINENVAQKRVTRAVQELATLLKRRGVALSATALAGSLAAGAVQAAPAGLAAGLAKVALASTATAATTAAVASTSAKLGLLLKLKLGLIGTILVGGLATTAYLHYHSKTLSRDGNQPGLSPSSLQPDQDASTGSPARPVYRSSPREPAPSAPPTPRRKAERPPAPRAEAVPAALVAAPGTAVPDGPLPDNPALPLQRFTAKSGSRVRIEGTSNLHDWQVEGSIIGGFLELDPSSWLDPSHSRPPGPVLARVEAFIPIRSLKSVEKDGRPYSDKMDEIMYDKLKSSDAKIRYRLSTLALTGTTNLEGALWYQFDSQGELTVAGVTNPITLPVLILPQGNGSLRISGSITLKMTSFGIQPPAPKLLGGLIRTGDDVKVGIDWTVAPRAEATAAATSQPGFVPLVLNLPTRAFKGTPQDLPLSSSVEPLSDKPRPPLFVPPGLKNLAPEAKITSSDVHAAAETLAKIIDGDKGAGDESIIFLRKGLQWVQMDLGQSREIFAVVLWHAHNSAKVYHDVVVQLSTDPELGEPKTLFNNDQDNTCGLGSGADREYFETHEGRLINTKGVLGRFLRFYSRGSTESALNEYTEIEVYGRPVP